MKVLVYESSKDRAKLIKDLLRTYRYKVDVGYGTSDSLRQVQEFKPSLIIININLRLHVELLDKLKQHSRLSHIPVILISNHNSLEIVEKISHLPNVDYLIEPFKIKNFRHIVERWINFRSLYVN